MIDRDADLTERLAAELATAPPMEVTWAAGSVFQFVAMIQLARRHPQLPVTCRALSDRFLAAVRVHFADYPELLDVIRRGDDPAEDVWGRLR